jgi:sortase A
LLRRITGESRAAAVALLLFALLTLSGCAGGPAAERQDERAPEATLLETPATQGTFALEGDMDAAVEEAANRATPDLGGELEGFPESHGWNERGVETAPVQFSSGTSAGAIPAVKPFNFGRDPGGPEDKMLYLTVPKLEIHDALVFDSVSEEKLKESAVHVPATGFPWQEGANTFIAGHRLGYPNTGSYRIFYDLDKLVAGDEIVLSDTAGGEYVYRVTDQVVVGPENVEVMNAVPGKSLVSLQTCTLPDYAERIVVQGELIERRA